MAVINLRNVPEELARAVKATAASEGQTQREFILGILERDIRRGGWTAAGIGSGINGDTRGSTGEAGNNSEVDERGVGGGIAKSDAGAVLTGRVRAVAGGGGGKAAGAQAGAGKGQRGEGTDKAALRIGIGVRHDKERISAGDRSSAAARVELGDTGGDQIDSRDARYPRPSLGGAGGEAENRLGEENKAVTVTLGWEAGKMPAGAAIKLACPQCGALGGVHQKNCKAGW